MSINDDLQSSEASDFQLIRSLWRYGWRASIDRLYELRLEEAYILGGDLKAKARLDAHTAHKYLRNQGAGT